MFPTLSQVHTTRWWGWTPRMAAFLVLVSVVGLAAGSSESPQLFNSSLACTRGQDRTAHEIDCKKVATPRGLLALIAVKRLFYGATPTSSQCHRTAPKENCCFRDPDKEDCVFESDYKLDQVALKCSGASYCMFDGWSVMSSIGKCSADLYPSITSFSFIEYECIGTSDVHDMCPATAFVEEQHQLYVDSNHLNKNTNLRNTDCSCIVYTKCGATILFEAVLVEIKTFNATSTFCVEEMAFRDLKDSSRNASYTCQGESQISNKIMFNSSSNAAMMRLDILDEHVGKMFMLIKSSDPNNTVKVECGIGLSFLTVESHYYCPGDIIDPDTPTTPETSTSLEGAGDQGGQKEPPPAVGSTQGEMHGGAIAGIVLAVVGILLVISQVVFFVWRHKTTPSSIDDSVIYDMSATPTELADDDHIYSTTINHSIPPGMTNHAFHNPTFLEHLEEAPVASKPMPEIDDDYVDVDPYQKVIDDLPPYLEKTE